MTERGGRARHGGAESRPGEASYSAGASGRVTLRPLAPHADARGVLTELHRESWGVEAPLAQWNLVQSETNVLRGVHVHREHWDYLILATGRMFVALYDARDDSPTEGLGASLEVSGVEPTAITVPPGVAHGFYFRDPTILVYAMSHEWDPVLDLGCRWDDPTLGVTWPCTEPLRSEKDRSLGSLTELGNAWREAPVAARA